MALQGAFREPKKAPGNPRLEPKWMFFRVARSATQPATGTCTHGLANSPLDHGQETTWPVNHNQAAEVITANQSRRAQPLPLCNSMLAPMRTSLN